MFHESGVEAQSYLWIAALVFFILFLGYSFWFDHKENIDDNKFWIDAFLKEGLSLDQIKDLTHDDSTWYYKRTSTCVGYGSGLCNRSENYCCGDETFGTSQQQAEGVAEALKSGGVHKYCPLIYLGTD